MIPEGRPPIGAGADRSSAGSGFGPPGGLTVTHEHGRSIGVGAGGVEILRYVYAADSPAFEAPKPYLHPLRTLSGALVTGYRPWDHRWHKGLQMTWSHVSGQNFWGGPSYVDGQGYQVRDNVGRMRHDGFAVIDQDGADHAVGADHADRVDGAGGGRLDLCERLTWITAAGRDWVSERRRLIVHGVETGCGAYALDLHSEMTNVSGHDLDLGSPTTHGRPAAGYTGWFWRGPRNLTGGRVTTSADPAPSPDPAADDAADDIDIDEAARVMGTSSAWLAYSGPNDGLDGEVTVLVMAGHSSRGPLHWFVRAQPFPAIAPSPAFHEPIVLAPGERLRLAHRFVIADGAWSREQIEQYLARLGPLEADPGAVRAVWAVGAVGTAEPGR